MCLYYQEFERGKRETLETLLLGMFCYRLKNNLDMKRPGLNQRLSLCT